MLKFWNTESYVTSAEGAQTSYVVYQDDTEPWRFYVAPNRPSIAINEAGKLSFLFRKYRFNSDPVENEKERQRREKLGLGGGYVVFDVVLRVPDAAKLDILSQLKAKYTKKLAKVEAAATAMKSARTALDAATDQNRAGLQAAFNTAKGGFDLAAKMADGLASIDDIQIAPIPFSDGTVQLNISPEKNAAFVQSITTLGKPAKDGNNTASFAAELTVEGATFFESAMSGKSGGAVQAFFSLRTWFRSSDTEVTAGYNKTNALKYDQVITESTGKTIWNEGSYNNKIDQTLQKNEVVDIKITWGSGAYTDEQTQAIRKWAFDAVADAVKRQLGDFTSPADAGSVNTGGGGRRTERHYDLKSTSDFSQTYRESFAMLMEMNPQGLLPNPGSIKDPADTTGRTYYQWADYYTEIDLDDPFFRTLRLGVSTDLDLSATSPVTRIEVELWYIAAPGGKNYHTTLTFARTDTGRKRWDPYGTAQAYSYQYTIYFSDGTRYVSAKLDATTKELVVGSASEGIAAVDVIANGFSPTTIRQCLLTLQVIDPTTKKRGPNKTVVLTNTAPQQKVVLPVGNEFASPYQFELTREYTLEPDGKRIAIPAALSGGSQLLIQSPFAGDRTVTLRAPGLGDGESVFVELAYTEGPQYSRTTTKTLDADNKDARWIFGIYDRAKGALTYSATFDLKAGSSEIPTTPAKGDSIVLRPSGAVDTQLVVSLDASLLDWDTLGLQIVDVQVTYGGKPQSQQFRAGKLPAEPPTKTWAITGGDKTYTYKVTYYVKRAGKTVTMKTQPQTSDSDLLVLPNPGEVPLEGGAQA